MTQSNRPINNKTKLVASLHDRYIGSVVPNPHKGSIHTESATSLCPQFVRINKKYYRSISPLLASHKEPHTDAYSNSAKPSELFNTSDNTFLFDKPYYLEKKNNLYKDALPFYIVASLILHALIVFILYVLYLKFPTQPNYGNSERGKPIDVVFMPGPTGSSGMTGDGVTAATGQSPPPPPPLASPPEVSQPLLSPEDIAPPEPEANQELLDSGEIPVPIPQPKPKATPKKHPTRDHNYTYRYTPRRQQRPQREAPKQADNPFANMQTLDFSENPSKSRRQATTRRLPQGSRSAINLSTGPLVRNGKINVPYAFKVNIKGVSDDYGDEINAWIKQHLYYPPNAARNGEDGSASVHVSLNRDGEVLSVNLTNSSGSDTLDAAITGMFRGARLPKIPPDLPDHFDLDLTINYILIRQ